MTTRQNAPLIAWATLAFAAVQSRDLLVAWRHSPLDQWGWVALAVWLVPSIAAAGFGLGPEWNKTSFGAVAFAAPLMILGVIFELHALNYAALALCVFAAGRPPRVHWIWLAGALSWMPALSWATRNLSISGLLGLRLAIAAGGSAAGLFALLRSKSSP
jgi:hypothetical protein